MGVACPKFPSLPQQRFPHSPGATELVGSEHWRGSGVYIARLLDSLPFPDALECIRNIDARRQPDGDVFRGSKYARALVKLSGSCIVPALTTSNDKRTPTSGEGCVALSEPAETRDNMSVPKRRSKHRSTKPRIGGRQDGAEPMLTAGAWVESI